jgi:hypothetical protein
MPFSYFYCVPRRRNTFTAFYCCFYRFLVYRLYPLSKILVDSLLAITIINKTQRQQMLFCYEIMFPIANTTKKTRILSIGGTFAMRNVRKINHRQ